MYHSRPAARSTAMANSKTNVEFEADTHVMASGLLRVLKGKLHEEPAEGDAAEESGEPRPVEITIEAGAAEPPTALPASRELADASRDAPAPPLPASREAPPASREASPPPLPTSREAPPA